MNATPTPPWPAPQRPLVLATDLDGTFLGGSEAQRLALYRWIDAHRDSVTLVFVTGRDLPFIRTLVRDTAVPRPDYVVGDVGTTIAGGPDLAPIEALERPIAQAWGDAGARMRALLEGEPGLQLQDTPFRYRLSYFYEPARLSPAVVQKVRDAGFDCLLSADLYLDVLPRGVSKGPTLLRLAEHLRWPRESLLVAGDTLNDLSLFETGLAGVAVGNSEPALRPRLAPWPRVHQSTWHGAAGIADALRHHGFIHPHATGDTFPLMTQHIDSHAATKKSSLVIVYHRQPYEEVVEDGRTVYREHKSPNGIVPTLKSFFGAVDQGAWVAWKQADPKHKDKDFQQVVRMRDSYGEYNVSRLPLTAAQVRSFYHVTSKEALWPILHSFPERYNYDAVDWPVFREVNRLFAQAAVEQAEHGATIWVHDYNLWLVPGYVRALRPDVRLAFFHHTPFPSSSIFNILPWREEIIDSLLACDEVGFHIPRYASGFVATARNLKGVEIVEEVDVEPTLSPVGLALSEASVATRIRHRGGEIRVDSIPVGTNVRYIAEVAASARTAGREQQIRHELGGRRLILSVGRSDYTKGTRDMLLAFERLLERSPQIASQVQLLVTSVAAASGMTVYKKVQHEIEQDRRTHQRPARHAGGAAAAADDHGHSVRGTDRLLPLRGHLLDHAAARRPEPGGQGVRGRAARPGRRAGAVGVHRCLGRTG